MIVFPMAGLSRRFSAAGYTLPKYQLPLHGRPVFDYAVTSFSSRFIYEKFLFIMRDVSETEDFVKGRVEALGIADPCYVVLDHETKGQADTVRFGLEMGGVATGEPLTIFNIDSFRPGYVHPKLQSDTVGYLETFLGEGEGWSFVSACQGDPSRVEVVSEKVRISELCCTGLYGFRDAGTFLRALEKEQESPSQHLPELYVAPVYNQLIREGSRVEHGVCPSGSLFFCGIPEEYEALKSSTDWLSRFHFGRGQ